MKKRVLYLLDRYPQLSETYIKVELEVLSERYDIRVVALNRADLPYRNHVPFELFTDGERLTRIMREFRPDVLHTHYVTTQPGVASVARAAGVPYTVRSHSFDAIRVGARLDIDSLCLGILAFPFARGALQDAGVPAAKIIDCWPVIDYLRFHDESPNGDAVLNVGACLPKKRFEDFIELATRMPQRTLDLYAIGYGIERIAELNARRGGRVSIHSAVQPEEMGAVYKAHGWLVYTACPKLATVGWPMSVAEAQASGLGICIPRLRADLEEFVGGAGYLYDSIEEVPGILAHPYPGEMRRRGFEHARKSDIREHAWKLTDLWDAS